MSAEQHHSVLSKVLAATLAGFIVLIFSFQYLLQQQQAHELQAHLDDDLSMVKNEIDSNIRIRSSWMETSLLLFQHSADEHKLVNALQAEKREQLYILASDYYRALKKQNEITHMYFMDSDRRVVLRMHQPDHFGDVVTRQSAMQAEQKEGAASGIELGPLGTLTLRVVVPWVYEKQRVGYLELGMEMGAILKVIEQDSPFNVILALHKELLQEPGWQLGQDMLNREVSWSELEHYVLAYPSAGLGGMVGIAGDFLNNPEARSEILQVDDRTHGLVQEPFADADGVEIGHLSLLVDLTSEDAGLQRGLHVTMALFALLVAAIVLLLYLIISKAERARGVAEDKLKLAGEVLAQTADGVIITDHRGYIIDVNAAFEHVTGFSKMEALGRKPSMLSSGEQDSQFYRDMWISINEKGQWRGRIVNCKKSGETYPEHLSITAICNEAGEVSHYIGVFSDISEQEALEKQYHETRRLDSLGTLVGGIAHEFNNLLAGMTGNLYLAMGEVKDNPVALEKLKTVEQLSFYAAEMIRQLLSFARKDVVRKEIFEVNGFISEGLKDLGLPEGVKLICRPAAEPLMIKADREQFNQVLLHLIENAKDAVKQSKKPKIIVSSCLYVPDDGFYARHAEIKDKRLLCLSIIDNGSGIDAAHLDTVFEPFFTTKEVGEGAGLGLSMVFGAVKGHGGVIEVDSSLETGTAIRIYCPLCEEPAVREAAVGDILKGHGEAILVVDDDRLIIDTAQKVLVRLGYSVITAGGGRQGLEIFREQWQGLDLVMLDIVMPGMDGIEVARAMRNINPDVKIIFVTGYEESEIHQGSVERHGEVVLRKPYSILQLSRLLHGRLNSD